MAKEAKESTDLDWKLELAATQAEGEQNSFQQQRSNRDTGGDD